MQRWNSKLCVFLATSYQNTGQKQQVSKASSIETHVTQFKSAKIKLKKWKLAVRFFMCSWLHKAMKFHTWHRTGTMKSWSIQYMQITHSLLYSHQTWFFVHRFTYLKLLPVNFWNRPGFSTHLLNPKQPFVQILNVHGLLNMYQSEGLILLIWSILSIGEGGCLQYQLLIFLVLIGYR